MRDRLLLLLLFGVGVVKIYEEFDDDERDEGGSLELMKHKHNRRDTDAVARQRLPDPISVEIVEAVHVAMSPKLFSRCKEVSDECTCSRLLCFGQPNCDQEIDVKNRTRIKSTYENHRNHTWVKRCRQTSLLGQNLCECSHCLYAKGDFETLKKLTQEVVELNPPEPALF
ncbi:hypothetical protein EG68_08475 [Paragonimus skrjabini miyazakii]|uniref:Uncharacterized protein n=1 Tax=Paragonimus skrjabini miyazakii TaxID=59628 RepID=A0A8S9YBP6_9TREM|nr:hypothetical protein EG68_08475 [Paragonimus skrjabini miyazakii]